MPARATPRAGIERGRFREHVAGMGRLGKSPNNFGPERGFLFFNQLRRLVELAGKLHA